MNPFDLLGDDDGEDLSQLIAAQQAAAAAAAAAAPKKAPAQGKPASQGQPNKPASLPSKPLPPTQAGEVLFLMAFVWLKYIYWFISLYILVVALD